MGQWVPCFPSRTGTVGGLVTCPVPLKAIPTLTFPRWTWAGVNLTACCGPKGFKSDKKGCKCKVQHKKDAAECGPSPYYTNR